MPVHRQHDRPLGALVRQRNELALQVQQMPVDRHLSGQNLVAVIVAKIPVVIQVARREDRHTARIPHLNRNPQLPFGREPRGQIVAREEALDFDTHAHATAAALRKSS